MNPFLHGANRKRDIKGDKQKYEGEKQECFLKRVFLPSVTFHSVEARLFAGSAAAARLSNERPAKCQWAAAAEESVSSALL